MKYTVFIEELEKAKSKLGAVEPNDFSTKKSHAAFLLAKQISLKQVEIEFIRNERGEIGWETKPLF